MIAVESHPFLLNCKSWRKTDSISFLDRKTCEKNKVKLHAVYKNHAPSMITVRYWLNEFKRGRTSVFDEERSGRPIEVTTEDIIN